MFQCKFFISNFFLCQYAFYFFLITIFIPLRVFVVGRMLGVCLVAVGLLAAVNAHDVVVSVDAKWEGTSLLAETR